MAKGTPVDVVASSWRRCIDTYKLDASAYSGPQIVTDQELQAARNALGLLRAVASDDIRGLLCRAAAANFVTILADPAGVALDVDSSMPIDSEMVGLGVRAGAVWSEPLAGTCGIGTALVEQRAVVIRRNEHFFHAYGTLTCMAAPIWDWNGALIAALGVSSAANLPRETESLALELVEAMARRIGRRYFLAHSGQRPVFQIQCGLADLSCLNA